MLVDFVDTILITRTDEPVQVLPSLKPRWQTHQRYLLNLNAGKHDKMSRAVGVKDRDWITLRD